MSLKNNKIKQKFSLNYIHPTEIQALSNVEMTSLWDEAIYKGTSIAWLCPGATSQDSGTPRTGPARGGHLLWGDTLHPSWMRNTNARHTFHSPHFSLLRSRTLWPGVLELRRGTETGQTGQETTPPHRWGSVSSMPGLLQQYTAWKTSCSSPRAVLQSV